jgi:putative ABC transport system permease protein
VRWRLALRLAHRDARRAKGRTVLVALMVGLPVAAIVGGDTLYRTNEVDVVEALPSRLGSADARIDGVARGRIWADPLGGDFFQAPGSAGPPWTAEEVREHLPAGVQLVEQQAGRITLGTDIGYATVDGYADDLTHPIRDGAFPVLEGRAPVEDGEVAISSTVAQRGIEVGDRLRLTRDDVPATVVGVLGPRAEGDARFLVLPPEAGDLLTSPQTRFFADVPGGLDWPAVQELNRLGLAVVSREVVTDPPPAAEYLPPGYPPDTGMNAAQLAVVALIVAALLLEVVLLAGPAFAVGLRRQRRDLALIAASGGSAGDLRRTVLASGLVLGGGAAVVGALLGIGLTRLALPVLVDRTGAVVGPFDVPLLDVVVVVAVGALAGLAAAYVPARQAARTDVVTTLTGRRGQVRSSWRLPVLGLLIALGGLLLTVAGAQGTELAVAGGAVLLVAGVVLATPWLVGLLGPLARRLPVSGRLAVRDATRNRTRTAPAVAAVMATVAGVTALAIGSASDSAQSERDYVPRAAMGTALIQLFEADDNGWAAARRAAEEQLPDRTLHEVRGVVWREDRQENLWVRSPGCTGGVIDCTWYPRAAQWATMLGEVVVLDADTMAALLPPELGSAAVDALRTGHAVVFGRGAVDGSGQLTLTASRFDGTTDEEIGRISVPASAIAVPTDDGTLVLPAMVVVPPELAEGLPIELGTTMLLAGGPDQPVTEAEQARVEEAVGALTGELDVYVERGFTDELWLVRLILLGVGGTLVLVATSTATGLALADARPDLATLAAIGAAPRTRRRMAMGMAAVIGGVGALLGVLAGLAPGIAVAYPLTSDHYGTAIEPVIVLPWDMLAAVALGVPLLAVLVTGLLVRSRLPMVTRIAG